MSLRILNDLEQGSPDWHEARRGIVTASVVGRLITQRAPGAIEFVCPSCGATTGNACLSKRGGTEMKTTHPERAAVAESNPEGLPRIIEPADDIDSRALTLELVAQRITGKTDDTWVTRDMERGIFEESRAREYYSANHAKASEVGFMVRDDWGFEIGYSPDGLVGKDGLIEVKAPRAKTHIQTVIANEVPVYNMAQLQAGLLVSGRKWIDFIPFYGGLPLWKKRIYPEPVWAEAIVAAVKKFEAAAADMTAAYEQATTGLVETERIDFNELGLVF